MSSLLNRIYDLQEKSGYSASYIAKSVGLPNSAFSEWRRGKASPSLDAITKLANFFEVTIDYIVLGKELAIENSSISEDDQKLLNKYHSLPRELQIQLTTYLDGMIDTLSIVQTKKLSS